MTDAKAEADAEAARLAEGAYVLAVIGGHVSPSASVLKVFLDAGGVAVDQVTLDRVIAKNVGTQLQVPALLQQQLGALARAAGAQRAC